MTAATDFYTTPGPMTDMSDTDPQVLAGLPGDVSGLCGVSKGLIVHEFLAGAYGVGDVSHRLDELETRPVGEMVATITGLDSRPLVEPRIPVDRMVGNCRQHTVLSCGLLRRAGIPARARAGFAGYFGDGWTDHWILERWDSQAAAWVRTDCQIDDIQRQIFGIGFDAMRLPEDSFLTGAEAWRNYRNGDDPQTYGIQEMRGPWFIAASVIRDLAALNKAEVHVWDTWGVIDALAFRDLSADQVALIDEVAEAVLDGDHENITALYQRDGLRVPGAVTSNRFQRTVTLPELAS